MVMPNAYPALSLAPQTASYIASDSPLKHFAHGRKQGLEDQQRNLLRDVGQQAASGNISGASRTAFRGGNVQAGMNFANWDTNRRIKAVQMLHEGAKRADTPEKWNALISTVERTFGPEMVGGYRDFSSRPSTLTALERAQLQLRQAQTRAATAKADAANQQAQFRERWLNRFTGDGTPAGAGVPSGTPPATPAGPAAPAGAPEATTPSAPSPLATQPMPLSPPSMPTAGATTEPEVIPPNMPEPSGAPGMSFGAGPSPVPAGVPGIASGTEAVAGTAAPGTTAPEAPGAPASSGAFGDVIGSMDGRTRAALAFALGTGDDRTVARILTGGASGKPPASIREYRFDMAQRRQTGQPIIPYSQWTQERKQPLVEMNRENEYSRARGKALAEDYNKLLTGGQEATGRIAQLRQIDALLSNPSVYTGTGGQLIANLKEIGKTLFGMEFEGVGPTEAARSVGNAMALDLRQNMPGTMSDRDLQFLLEMPPNISMSTEGRKLLVDMMVAREQRRVEVAQLAREYQRANGRLDEGWYDTLASYNEANPLFTPEMMGRAMETARGAPQQSPAAGVVPRISSDEEFDELPSGTRFIGPDGKLRRKP